MCIPKTATSILHLFQKKQQHWGHYFCSDLPLPLTNQIVPKHSFLLPNYKRFTQTTSRTTAYCTILTGGSQFHNNVLRTIYMHFKHPACNYKHYKIMCTISLNSTWPPPKKNRKSSYNVPAGRFLSLCCIIYILQGPINKPHRGILRLRSPL